MFKHSNISCGVAEIFTVIDPTKELYTFADAIYNEKYKSENSQAFPFLGKKGIAIWSNVDPDHWKQKYGGGSHWSEKFHGLIEKNGLGQVYKSPATLNYRYGPTGHLISVWVWTIDQVTYTKWWKEKQKLAPIPPVIMPPGPAVAAPALGGVYGELLLGRAIFGQGCAANLNIFGNQGQANNFQYPGN